MTAKQSYTAAKFLAAIDAYKRGDSLTEIEKDHGVPRGTLYNAMRTHGVPRNGMSAIRARRAEKYKLLPPEEMPCQCGGGCGLTFKRTHGQRQRRFHPECHVRRAFYRKNEQAAERRARLRELKARDALPSSRGFSEHAAPRKSISWCKECAGLPSRRGPTGCLSCGLPYADEPGFDRNCNHVRGKRVA